MVLFNYSTKELTAKIVYYGPGLCGKTSNLQYIHGNLPGNVKGKMLSLATKTDRTLFFDFLPIDLGEIRGMKTRVQLYTVPGQVFYNETRKLVLKGADGIVFVADSQEQMLSANAESFKNLEENMRGHGLALSEMPHVIQFNKRDLPKLATIEQLNSTINKYNAPFYESVATTGIGIQDTLKAITKLVLLHLTRKYDPRAGTSQESPAAAPQPTAPAVPTMQAPMPGPEETQAIPLASIQTEPGATIAISADALPMPMPTPAQPAVAASIEPVPVVETPAPAAAAATGPEFDDKEIDELVCEVEELDEAPAAVAVEAEKPSPFQIDSSNVAFEEPVEPTPTLATPEEIAVESVPPLDLPEPVEESPALDLTQDTPFTDQPAEPVAEFDSPEAAFSEPEAAGPFDDPAAIEEPSIESLPLDDLAEQADSDGAPEEVMLTEVAEDQALFDDPGLDVAGISPGEERSIVIPVELGDEGQKQRYKLSVRLRLDPVD